MLKLRKFLRVCYGYLAAIFLLAATGATPFLFRILREPSHLSHAGSAPRVPIGAMNALLGLILGSPLVIGTVSGMAWWTLRTGKPSSRRWAIGASIAAIILGLPLLGSAFFQWKYGHIFPLRPLLFYLPMLALGVAGLAAFWHRDFAPQPASTRVRIAGDGTNSFLDAFAGILAGVGILVGMRFYMPWGRAHGLPIACGYVYWLEILAVTFVVTTIHELGHASIGLALGMKLRAFVLGPFNWVLREGKWIFRFNLVGIISAEGVTGVVPANPKQSLWDVGAMIAAGPFANLITGILALAAMYAAPGQLYAAYWESLAFFGTVSLVTFALNLLPIGGELLYSDGARIYQIIKGGPWADFQRTLAIVGSTLVTPTRPRDYDIEAIQRAAAALTHGREALLLRLYASSSYYLDRGKIREACESIADTDRIYQESPAQSPPELLMALVFRAAFLCRDAVIARLWWDRMEVKKPSYFGVDYWLARSALLWIENDIEEARKAWSKGNALAQQLPSFGDYDFDRDRAMMLHRAIDAAAEAAD